MVVKIKGSGLIGKIISTNETTGDIEVLTDEGDTIKCSKSDLELISNKIKKQEEDHEDKGNQEGGKYDTEDR